MGPPPPPAGRVFRPRRQLQTRDYTVGWICALPIELAAAQEMLDEAHEPILDYNDTLLYNLGSIHSHNVVIACLPAGTTGTQSAATVAARMRSRFTNIKFGLMVGIGGGVPSVELDIRLGDVVVSHPYQQHGGVVQYDFGKTMTKGHMRTGWLNAPPPVLLSAIVEQRARQFRRQSTLAHHLARFSRPGLESFTRKSAGYDWLFNATYEHPGGADCINCSNVEKVQRPGRPHGVNTHYGTIASGNQVMKDGVKRDEISKELGGVMCFEMEAAGLMNDFPCLVIRGICDYADSHKNKTWQPYAAATAAACAKEILTIVPALPEPAPGPIGQDCESGQTRVEMKLDLLMRELQLGYRTRAQIAQNIEKDLIDDNVTEVDVEENREFIDEWLKTTKADGWFVESAQEQLHASHERPEAEVIDGDRSQASRQNSRYPKHKQARCGNVSDEDQDRWSDRDNDLLSDAETEVAEEYRAPPNPKQPTRPGLVPDDTRDNKPVSSWPRQDYHRSEKRVPTRKSRSKVRRPLSKSRSPIPRRRHRKPYDTQDQYDRPYVPVQSQYDSHDPRYDSDQPYPQPYYGEPIRGHRQGAYGHAPPYYDSRYNGRHGDVPHAYPPPRPPPEEEIKYGDAIFDRHGRFVGNVHVDPRNVPSYDSQSRPRTPNPFQAAEPSAGNSSMPENPFHFSTGGEPKNSGFNFSNPENIFAEFLRSGGGNANDDEPGDFRRGVRPSRKPEMEVTIVEKPLRVTLEEIFNGTVKKMKVKRKTYNQTTGSTATEDRILEVPIKRGLKAGSKIKFSDIGDQVEGGTQDLHFILSEKPHPIFRRDGDDIYHTIKLGFLESLCGWTRTVTSIDGKQVAVSSSGPTGPAWKEIYPMLGMPKSKAPTERGNMIIEVSISFPTTPLTQDQKKALKDIFPK